MTVVRGGGGGSGQCIEVAAKRGWLDCGLEPKEQLKLLHLDVVS